MPLVLQPALKENAMQRVEVQIASYSDDPIVQSIMPGVCHEEKMAFFVGLFGKESRLPWVKDLEIVDTDTGKVVAAARWKYPTPKKADGEGEVVAFPSGTNVPLSEAVFAAFRALTDKYLDSEKMYFLDSMLVDPAYQRRGLGQQLMEQAVKDADRDGAQAFLLATDAGKRLYAKFGFKELEVKELDFVEFGASGKRNTTAMMRVPNSVPK